MEIKHQMGLDKASESLRENLVEAEKLIKVFKYDNMRLVEIKMSLSARLEE